MTHQFDGLGGGVGTGAGHDRNPTCRRFHAQLYHAPMFVMAEGSRLARGADGHKTVHAAGDLTLDQSHKSVLIQRAIAKGSDQRRQDAVKQGIRHGDKQMTVKLPHGDATFRFGATICRRKPSPQRRFRAVLIRTEID